MPPHFDPNEDRFRRFKRLMPRGSDITLIMLKGHLLIEEELDIFLENISRAPKYLSEARLSFNQRLRLMQAIALYPDDNLGRFVEGVGQLRNKLAHRAEVGNLNNAIDALLKILFEENYIEPKDARQRARFLKTALAFTCGVVNGYARGFT